MAKRRVQGRSVLTPQILIGVDWLRREAWWLAKPFTLALPPNDRRLQGRAIIYCYLNTSIKIVISPYIVAIQDQ